MHLLSSVRLSTRFILLVGVIFISSLLTMIACGNGGPCNPACNTSMSGTGQQTSTPFTVPPTSAGLLAATDPVKLILQLPTGSLPGTKDRITLLVNDPNLIPKSRFITFVAIPADASAHTFTAQSLREASPANFANQKITYSGASEKTDISCLNSNECAKQSIEFSLNGLNFSFTLNAKTIVQPPSIKAGQTVNVLVQFEQGKPPSVLEVTQVGTQTPTEI